MGGFVPFSLLFLHMGSQLTIMSLSKCLRDLEDPHLDVYGGILYESGSSINPFVDALLHTLIYSKSGVYKDNVLSHGRPQNRMLNLNLFLHICSYSWTM
jgi:hypothetical protein